MKKTFRRAMLFTLISLSFFACSTVDRVSNLRKGMSPDEVDETLGSNPIASSTGEISHEEIRTYSLKRKGSNGLTGIGGAIPEMFPVNFYALFDTNGKLIAGGFSSKEIEAMAFIRQKAQWVFNKWGAPTQQQDSPDGGKAYTYIFNTGSNGRFISNISDGSTALTNSASYTLYCKISFLADPSGVVTNTTAEGNNCD